MKTQSKSFRSATSSPATLRVDDGRSVACIVRNLSAGGAKIELGPDDVVPDRLHIAAAELNIDAEADVVWRQPPLMGVRFLTRQPAVSGRTTDIRPAASRQPIGLGDITAPATRVAVFK